MENVESFVVCVTIDEPTYNEVVIRKCCKCGRAVWCSVKNLGLQPICVYCLTALPGVKHMCIDPEDLKLLLRKRAKGEFFI